MRVGQYDQMILEYEDDRFDADDKFARSEILNKLPNSVIVEGEYLELETLERWIRSEFGDEKLKGLYYSKTGYDFCFAEYFFGEPGDAEKVAATVPYIYTFYPASSNPDMAIRTEGYETIITHDPADEKAILFLPEK